MKKLISLLIGAAMLMAGGATVRADEAAYIFYFIGDGMGPGAVMAAENYLRATTNNPDTTLLMTSLPVASLVTTFSASSPVTDSAAAGTALATGRKTRNGMIGMTPDSLAAGSIAQKLKQLGYGIGIVTNVAADDATPAAFYAAAPSRSMYHLIGSQAARSGFDFIAGAGLRGFSDKDGNPTNLAADFDRYKYQIVRGMDALSRTDARKIILLSTDTVANYRIGYTVDGATPDGMELPAITRAAISHLNRVAPESFFLMVEGGAIDHAAHANDAGGVIADVLKFDEALRQAYDFYLAHPDETLIIVTADHETGGMALGNNHLGYMTDTPLLAAQRISKDKMSDTIHAILKSGLTPSWAEMKQFLADNLGFGTTVELTPAQWQRLEQSYRDTFVDRIDNSQNTLYNRFTAFAVDAFSILDQHTGIGWTSVHHTGNPVPLFAIGTGADAFRPLLDNTRIPLTILQIADTHRPTPPLMH